MSSIPGSRKIVRTSSKRVTPSGSTSNTTIQSRSGTSREVTISSKWDSKTGQKKQLGRIVPNNEGIERPSQTQKDVFKQALTKLAYDPTKKVRTVGMARGVVPPPSVQTKRGREQVVQQMKMQTTVQRTPKAEYIGKTMVGIDVGPSGVARKLELTSQQIDPTHGTESAGVNETISTTSTLSITKGGKQLKKVIKKRTVTSDSLAKKPNLNPNHVSRLVIEEIQDVENTLKMVPPELISTSVEKAPLRKKLRKLRLSAEPVSVLTESIVYPKSTADEMDAEAPPEVVASVIDAVEKGASPEAAPNQVFNNLFPEVQERRINVSSVAPGPLEDVVVPTTSREPRIEEMLTQELEEFLVAEVQNQQTLPTDDICFANNIKGAKKEYKGNDTIPDILEGELPPWEDTNIMNVSGLVGADPMFLLDTSDITQETSPADLSQELEKGIEYYIDADVAPYRTNVQLRGSKLPRWFPGFMGVFAHYPDLVKVSKSPSQVLYTAWKAVQPKIFPEDSLLIA